MHTIRFRLVTTAYEEHVLEKRFHALSHIHNVTVKHARALLRQLEHHSRYQELREEYAAIRKEESAPAKGKKPDADSRRRKTQLAKEMTAIRAGAGLSEAGLQFYIKKCGRMFRSCLSSQQVQKEASRVWAGVEKVLFGNGKDIHFKKYMEFDTVPGKSNLNGARFDREGLAVSWLGLDLKCRHPKDAPGSAYTEKSLAHKVCYCEVCRKMFPNGWHYYVTVYLEGDAPRRRSAAQPAASGTMGIDPGVSTIAAVSGTAVFLEELAPGSKKYASRITKLQEKMDRSRRAANPDRYHEDGTVKKGCRGKWKASNTYLRDQRKLKSLYRQKAAYTKQAHAELAGRLLADSVNIIVEGMRYRALQKRAKKTVRREEVSTVVQKDGTARKIHKCRRKKRFGKSLNSRAPALFLTILKEKALRYGGSFETIDAMSYKASQYNHVSDTYKKVPLSQRSKTIGGKEVQRDLYSAFLIRNCNAAHDHPDRDRCAQEFGRFLRMQGHLIETMKQDRISMKHCFGF